MSRIRTTAQAREIRLGVESAQRWAEAGGGRAALSALRVTMYWILTSGIRGRGGLAGRTFLEITR